MVTSPTFIGLKESKTNEQVNNAVASIDHDEGEDLNEDNQEEGMQADDEDNDQIETERVLIAEEKQDQSQYNRILKNSNYAHNNSGRNQKKYMGSSSSNFNKSSKRTMSYK